MAGAVSRLRRMEHPDRRAPIDDYSKTPGIAQGSPDGCLLVAGRRSRSRTIPADHRLDRARSGAGRRSGAGVGHSDRRRSGDRKIDADAAGGGGPQWVGTGALCHRGRVFETGRTSGSPAGLEDATARLMAETCVEDILDATSGLAARVLIVDSIQTMHSERIESAPGAVSQLRECTAELVRFAKASGTAVLLVGAVTKEGQNASPRGRGTQVDTG